MEFLEHPWYRFNLLSISVHQNVERLGLKYARKLEVKCDAFAVRASLECSLIDLASVSYYIWIHYVKLIKLSRIADIGEFEKCIDKITGKGFENITSISRKYLAIVSLFLCSL